MRTARERRRWLIGLLILWNTVGAYVTVVWRNELWWVQVMSHLGITVALGACFFAETPVEPEASGGKSARCPPSEG